MKKKNTTKGVFIGLLLSRENKATFTLHKATPKSKVSKIYKVNLPKLDRIKSWSRVIIRGGG